MKARFIGDPNDNYSGPDVFPLRGVTFLKDKWTSVADEALFAKLQTHNHFETADAGFVSIAPEITPGETVTIEIGQTSSFDLNTGRGYGVSGAGGLAAAPASDVIEEPATDEKAALIAELETFADAEFDRRWGAPKLRQALEAAKFMAGDED